MQISYDYFKNNVMKVFNNHNHNNLLSDSNIRKYYENNIQNGRTHNCNYALSIINEAYPNYDGIKGFARYVLGYFCGIMHSYNMNDFHYYVTVQSDEYMFDDLINWMQHVDRNDAIRIRTMKLLTHFEIKASEQQ